MSVWGDSGSEMSWLDSPACPASTSCDHSAYMTISKITLSTSSSPPPTPPSPQQCQGPIIQANQDCTGHPECCPTNQQCWRKDMYWAGCLSSCVPGIHNGIRKVINESNNDLI